MTPAVHEQVDHRRLNRVLRDLTRRLVRGYQVVDVLYELSDVAVDLAPISGAGVMLSDADGVLRFVAASDATVQRIENLQIELGEGPCLRAFETGHPVVIDDLASSDQFPVFGPEAADQGLRAVSSFPMRVGDRLIGALNFYSDESSTSGPDAASIEVGQTLADVATSYIVHARDLEESERLTAQLQHALGSRVIIEQAKGKLSEQLEISVDRAFAVLRRYARLHGLKLHAVAEDVVNGRLRLRLED